MKHYIRVSQRTLESNIKKVNEKSAQLISDYSEVLYFYPANGRLQGGNHYWFFGDVRFEYLTYFSSNSDHEVSASETKSIDHNSGLIQYIQSNRLDTINSLPGLPIVSSHPRSIEIMHFRDGDTLYCYSLRTEMLYHKKGSTDQNGLVRETQEEFERRINHPRLELYRRIVQEIETLIN